MQESLKLIGNLVGFSRAARKKLVVTQELLAEVLQESLRRFDKGGEAFYDQIGLA